MNSTITDERDAKILAQRQSMRDRSSKGASWPLVGDVLLLADGTVRRVAHFWPAYGDREAEVQPSSATIGSPRNYLCSDGSMEFSGALDGAIPCSRFRLTGRRGASAWFFRHNEARAHNGIDVTVEVNEWTEEPA